MRKGSSAAKRDTPTLPDPCLFAQHLIYRCAPSGEHSFVVGEAPSVRIRDVGGVVINSGFTTYSALHRPVWWRIERRGEELFYCSSFWLSEQEMRERGYSTSLPNVSGLYPATIETLCRR
jgi:hypothetical protein